MELILAGYRKADLADPDKWNLQVAMVLGRFPKEVVDYVTDPYTGVQAHIRFGVPNLADIVAACDERMAQLRTHFDRTHPPALEASVDRSNRPTYEELKAKYGPNWGLHTVDEVLTPTTS